LCRECPLLLAVQLARTITDEVLELLRHQREILSKDGRPCDASHVTHASSEHESDNNSENSKQNETLGRLIFFNILEFDVYEHEIFTIFMHVCHRGCA